MGNYSPARGSAHVNRYAPTPQFLDLTTENEITPVEREVCGECFTEKSITGECLC